ncbi:MAG: MFS transporter, partial [Deltaproteobacteria bacterium]|nr:MFS transporter [Deltaproteobacteria bacterium]
IQGAGCAMMFGTGAAILTSVFPAGERGKALGINVTSVYAGLTLGPFLGGFLTQHLGWRSIFWLNLALATMAIALVLSKMKGEWAEAKGERFDFKGSIVYALSLSLLMFGFSNLPEERGMWLAAAGVAGILVFIKVEIVTKSPVLEIALFRKNAVFAMSNLAAFVNYSATFAAGFLMSLYLQYIRSYTPQNAGLILATYPVAMAFFSPFAGGLSDRVEPRFVASAGMLFTFVSLIMLSFTGEKTPIAYIISSLTLLGTGIALFSSPNANAIMSSVERKFYGVASASIGTMRLLGQMFSMGIATLMISFFIGNAKIRPENHGEFVTVVKTAFLVFGAICFFGIFASFARGDVRKYDLKGESK